MGNSALAMLFAPNLIRETPLTWFLAGCLLAGISLFAILRRSPLHCFHLLRNLAFLAGSLAFLVYMALSLYSMGCFMLQADEANILAVAASTHHGLPMYYAPGAADTNVSLMYGPVTFLIYRTALVAGGVNHFWMLRSLVVAAGLGLFAALYVLLRRFVARSTSVAMFAFPASILMQHPWNSIGIRSDIWIMLCAALAMLCAFLDSEIAALVLTGVLGGLVLSLKISAGPAILLPLIVLYRRFGPRGFFLPVPVAAIVAILPFASSTTSLHNYLAWVAYTRMEGLSPRHLWLNGFFALFLIAPCLLMELFLSRYGKAFRNRAPEFLVIVLGLLLGISTSKPGSGPWYFWHLVPSVIVYLGLTMKHLNEIPLRDRAIPVYLIAAGCTLLTCINVPRACQVVHSSLMPPSFALARQDLNRYLEVYRGRSSLQMADGSVPDDESTRLRYILVYQGQPYTIDGNTGRFETRLLPFPVKVLDRMAACTDDVWLVPHAQQPFDIYIFPPILRTTFLANYRIDRTSDIYDAWVCHHTP
jgi:hypothetical protein